MKPIRDFVRWYLKRKNMVAVPSEIAGGMMPNQSATFAAALARLRRRNLKLGTVIDIGASDGRWTREVLPLFPTARFLCVEAQPAHEAKLKDFVSQHSQVEYALCAAGERVGETSFDATDLLGGWVQNRPYGSKSITVPMSTVDQLVNERQLCEPFLIKLDTHGYEVPIITGAAATLQKTHALVVEVYNLPAGPPAVPFYEFCRWIASYGFRCIDMFDPLYRPLDAAFWQMDLLFLRDTRPEFQELSYSR
jgi:FkbM family methyltransferase